MAKTKEDRLLDKQKEKASKLTPRPILLPSRKWRCQVMVNGERLSAIDADPETAHAAVLAMKAGLIARSAEQSPSNITLTAAIDKYIEDRKNLLSPSTIRGYRIIQKNRFPSLMDMKVKFIEKADLQRAINEQANLSSKTLKSSVGLVQSVMSEYRDISVPGLKYPQRVKKEHAYLDTKQIVELITACQGNIAEIPILLAVWLGLRRSEIMGLRWESVSFSEKTIRIERSLVANEDGVYVEKSQMKNETSRRTLQCPDYILEKLNAYQTDESKRTGRIFKMDPSVIYNNLKKICVKNEIPFVGVHGLRHTNASVMLSLGIVDKVAMKRGGWATDNTMKSVYQHVFSSDIDTADSLINAYFESMLK